LPVPTCWRAFVEPLSGESYDRLLRTRIFVPLGMNDTSYLPTDAQRARAATIYTKTANGLTPARNTFSNVSRRR
jgi:CubicO group peptidase (beta-lactamase class C family)